MNIKIFNLDSFFQETQKYYYFFDGIFNYSKQLKKDVLNKVGIYDSSYRADRLRKKVCNGNRFLLLSYFKVNNIDINHKSLYECCISKIYYATYFVQQEQMKDLLVELEEYISENNYLKPLFVLFKMLGSTILLNSKKEQNKIFKDSIPYLYAFLKTNYFSDEFFYIYLIMMKSFSQKVDINELNRLSLTFHNIVWLDSTFRGREACIDGKNQEAVLYWENALNLLKEDYNINRILGLIANLSLCYNLLEMYQMSLNLSSQVIQYIYSQKINKQVKYLTVHYLYANYMLGFYEQIERFFQVIILDKSLLSEQSMMLIILAKRKIGKLEGIDTLINIAKTKNKEEYKYLFMMMEALKELDLGHKITLTLFYSNNYYKTIKEEIFKEQKDKINTHKQEKKMA